MTFRDLIAVSTGNLLRLKLRAFLTVSGVVIAIAAFVAMLSFGAGNQEYVTKQFNDLGLLWTMQVYPLRNTATKDTTKPAVLDQAALDRISKLQGVRLAYPYSSFSVSAKLGDSSMSTKAQTMSMAAMETKLFSKFKAGKCFASDSAREVVVADRFLRDFKVSSADSLIGRKIVLTRRVSVVDSGLVHILRDNDETVITRLKKIHYDSLTNRDYLQNTIRVEANAAVRRFLNGFLNAQDAITDTVTISGVLMGAENGPLRTEPILVPVGLGRYFSSTGFSTDPNDLIAAMANGTFEPMQGDSVVKTYPQLTLDLDPHLSPKVVGDSIKAMGFRTFSFAEQFDEIRRFFVYFDVALGIIGLLALTTASLGIINTMVMSILERRKEIGVLKSLGADDSDIRLLFLVETGVIGVVGSLLGIVFGWIGSRIVSTVSQIIMKREGMPVVELFSLPVWLVLIAIVIGVGVSLMAGLYPARRAARIDPVEALRNE